jgi:hypothetical protein
MMFTVDYLRTEIERLVVAQHARVVIDALCMLDVMPDDSCSYRQYFHQYRTFNAKVTQLERCLRSDDGQSARYPASLDRALSDYLDRIHTLKSLRYSNVCGTCLECRSRRKRWPSNCEVEKPIRKFQFALPV